MSQGEPFPNSRGLRAASPTATSRKSIARKRVRGLTSVPELGIAPRVYPATSSRFNISAVPERFYMWKERVGEPDPLLRKGLWGDPYFLMRSFNAFPAWNAGN